MYQVLTEVSNIFWHNFYFLHILFFSVSEATAVRPFCLILVFIFIKTYAVLDIINNQGPSLNSQTFFPDIIDVTNASEKICYDLLTTFHPPAPLLIKWSVVLYTLIKRNGCYSLSHAAWRGWGGCPWRHSERPWNTT